MDKEHDSMTGERCSTRKLPSKDEIEELKEQLALHNNLSRIRHKVIVLSGKGGVGKSTVATNIAVALAMKGQKVGLMDVDIHGPSIPKMLGLEGNILQGTDTGLAPIVYTDNLRVMSVGFVLRAQDDAVIWRAPLKHKLIRDFLSDVQWRNLDYLIVDLPPGTGDEPLSISQLIPDSDGAIIVTTPQDVALVSVRKSINFVKKMKYPIIGIIENMSGFTCPHCNKSINIFKTGGGLKASSDFKVPFLGKVPLDPSIVKTGDSGESYLLKNNGTDTGKAFKEIVRKVEQNVNKKR